MADNESRDESRDEGRQESRGGTGSGLSSAVSEVVGDLQEVGAGLVVGANAYTDGVTSPNPYYQYGNVDTGGYGGPPNIGAVSHVFAKSRHDAMVFAGSVVDDTTGNAAAYGQGVGSGLAPELVTMPPLTGTDARTAAKANVDAAAAYQTAHPVMLHGLSDEVLAAGSPADEFGNPIEEGQGGTDEKRAQSEGDSAYDDHSNQAEQAQAQKSGQQGQTGQAQPPRAAQEPGQSQARQRVDPTRQQGQQNG